MEWAGMDAMDKLIDHVHDHCGTAKHAGADTTVGRNRLPQDSVALPIEPGTPIKRSNMHGGHAATSDTESKQAGMCRSVSNADIGLLLLLLRSTRRSLR